MTDWQTWALLDRLSQIEQRLHRIEQALVVLLDEQADEPGDMQSGELEVAPPSL